MSSPVSILIGNLYLNRFRFEGNGRIVFLGDSLTEGMEWSELFSDPNILYRGIGTDTLRGIFERLDNIITLKLEKIFIIAGINDVGNGKSNSSIIEELSCCAFKTDRVASKNRDLRLKHSPVHS